MTSTRISVIVCAMLFALDALSAERDWCSADVFPYDEEHPLASEVLLAEVFEDIYSDNWRRGYVKLAAKFAEFIDREALDESDENLRRFQTHLSVYLRQAVPPILTMRASYRETTDRMSWEFIPNHDGTANSLFVDCATMVVDRDAQAIAYFSDTMYEAGRAEQWKSIKVGADIVQDIYQTHRNRLFNGFPMWPQETLVNGLRIDFAVDTAQKASRTQWIFLRPSISPALRFSGTDDSEIDAGLVVEPFGFIQYRKGSQFKKWQGASLLVSVTGDNGVGYGALYRYGNWMIGAAYHEKTEDTMLYASIDLYDLIVPKDKRAASAGEFLKALGKQLVEKGQEQEDD